MAMHTPWGAAQTQTRIARGIIQVSTAGHGGIHLSSTLNAKVHPAWRDRKGWYEEDCEWAFVALTFPQHFKPEHVEQAHKSAKGSYPDQYEQVFGVKVTAEESHVRAEQEFRVVNAQRWVVDAAWGYRNDKRGRIPVPEGMVGVVARRPADKGAGDERWFLVPEAEYDGRHVGGSGRFATVVRDLHFLIDEERHQPWPERNLCPGSMKPVNRIGREALVSDKRGHMLCCGYCAECPGTYESANGLRFRDHEPLPWPDVVGTVPAPPVDEPDPWGPTLDLLGV